MNVLPFEDVAAAGLTAKDVGGKGYHLAVISAVLRDGGVSVPPGVCVCADVFRAHVAAAGFQVATYGDVMELVRRTPLDEVRRRIRATPLARHHVRAIMAHVQADGLYAVRSSGTAEDTAAASFAGQYDTVLGVAGTAAAIEAAVVACFASQFNDHVLSYLRRAAREAAASSSPSPSSASGGIGLDGAAFPAMAVVVQAQVSAAAAGVVFAVNPADCTAPEMVMEAVWGLGDALVSGDVAPWAVVVNHAGAEAVATPTTPPDHTQATKLVCVPTSSGGGTAMVPTTATQARTSVFDAVPGVVEQLVRVGAALSSHFGKPQDVEWAVDGTTLHILQSRPVTSAAMRRTIPRGSVLLATPSVVMDELLVARGFNRLVARFPLSAGLPTASIVAFGRVYVDTDAFDAVWAPYFPGDADDWFETAFMTAESLVTEFYDKHEPRLLASIGLLHGSRAVARAARRPSSAAAAGRALFTATADAAAFPPSLARMPSREGSNEALACMSDAALAAEAATVMEAYVAACEQSWTMGQCASFYEALTQEAFDDLAAAVDDAAELPKLMHLLTALDTRDGDPLHALTHMARSHARMPTVVDVMRDLLAAMDADPAAVDAFEWFNVLTSRGCDAQVAEFNTFLAQNYWQAEQDEDFTAEHWGENPLFPLSIYARVVTSGDTGGDRTPAATTSTERYHRARAQLEALQDVGAGARTAARLAYLRLYLKWKEEVHRLYVRIGYFLKFLTLEVARRLMVRGVPLSTPEALFHCPPVCMEPVLAALRGGDADAVAAAGTTAAAAAVFNARQKDMWAGVRRPRTLRPGRIRMHAATTSAADDEAATATATASPPPPPAASVRVTGVLRVLRGVACSSCDTGPRVGRARVVATLAASGRVAAGDVLITDTTSPSWAPLFAIIGALVLQQGSILSHGAVVARECGLNAVCGLRTAMTDVADGDWVEVDGETGTVKVVTVEVVDAAGTGTGTGTGAGAGAGAGPGVVKPVVESLE